MTRTTRKTPTTRPHDRGGTGSRARGGASGLGEGTLIGGALITIFAVVVLYLVYARSQYAPDETASGTASDYKHVAGDPGAGAQAPGFTLPSSTGGEISLGDYRGEHVLLYFQEGLMCQPCFDQITDLENNRTALDKAGVDKIASITSDPVGLLARKAADMNLATPILSDSTLAVIRDYDANSYGMMGKSRAGHSFILVGPDGTIEWRADYGGPPDYTMFLPTQAMLADLTTERSP